ncbi:MAG: tRNA (adenosine(37)-N6)-threonylcarbamoyltransferase complex ATPase subunit type 1 TsaE [Gemmatimonadetes bacterium]|nr:tRNA (adenosine(37)-N6)-threonylcarbamoyltransferase complex ATPase subunit type 1 TsaE [Gemmatimonadota bacterium]
MRLSEPELRRWGRLIGESLEAPAVLALSGPLGAGKSVLARAIGEGAGVREVMPSPTYTLVQRYPARGSRQLVHLDLYRLDKTDELWELGWAQLPDESDIVVIEWPERAGSLLPPDHWSIRLSTPPGQPNVRNVEVVRVGAPPPLAPFPLSPTLV